MMYQLDNYIFIHAKADQVTVSVKFLSIMWSKANCFCVMFGSVDGEYVRGLFCKSDMHYILKIILTGKIDDRVFYLSKLIMNSEVLCKIAARTMSEIKLARKRGG